MKGTDRGAAREPLAGLVLAAGESRRMGPDVNKLVARVDGRPLVAHAVDALCGADLSPVVVVVGFEADRVGRALADRACELVEHAGWREGMGSSLAVGTRAVLERAQPPGLVVSLGDLPRVDVGVVRRVIEAFALRGEGDLICVPVARNRVGHPVVFGAAYYPDLCACSGDEGGRSIIARHEARVVRVECPPEALSRDLDTPLDLAAWRRRSPS